MKVKLLLLLLFIFGIKANIIVNRFNPPAGYHLARPGTGSFGDWLLHLNLKPAGSHTLTYAGTVARTDIYTAAVIDMSVGKRDLQQCADAVMRLRAEYLYQRKDYKSISFNFASGFKCDYLHYANGYRYKNERWILSDTKDYSRSAFMRYLDLVFSYAGTLSLEKELLKVNKVSDLQAGDIFIKGGSPGHCFIIMAVASNSSGHKRFLLAQSFMPAQSIQILQNGSPWFSADQLAAIPYGELVDLRYLKRF